MHTTRIKRSKSRLTAYGLAALLLLAAFLTLIYQNVSAQESDQTAGQGSPLHPTFPLLDADGEQVLNTGAPVSTVTTCGACHDTDFITKHSFHADVGLKSFGAAGSVENGAVWDSSNGTFGKWNPLTYRYLSPQGDELVDLTTAEWIQIFGARHVGGGPAVTSRSGSSLTGISADAGNVESAIFDAESGQMVAWDWQASGTVEMNCFLCHLTTPNNEARVETLQSGAFGWANTATLLGTGIVEKSGDTFQWNADAFKENGDLANEFVAIQNPSNESCGQCHGLVHTDLATPLTLDEASLNQWATSTTGQVMSPQRLSDSGINLAGKGSLSRSWDVHTERVLACTDCHYSLNNPVYFQEMDETKPDHLVFDPRRIDLGDYLYRPLHQFAKGQSAQGTVAPELDNTLRRCESCHSVEATHDWLPYKDRHTTALSCESCHVPHIYAPTRQSVDWTVLNSDGTPVTAYRGIEGALDAKSLITGYEPVLLPRQNGGDASPLAPYNLITSWFWVYGEPERPVRQQDLQAAWLQDGGYAPAVVDAFDSDGNGVLDQSELAIDSDEKESLIASRLESLGLENPHIAGEIQPYSISHNTTHGEWATKECATCHAEDSRVTRPFKLAGFAPGGVMPTFVADSQTSQEGELYTTEDGQLYYRPGTTTEKLYVLGHDNVGLIDIAGIAIFLATLVGVSAHGGLRFLAARRMPAQHPQLKEVYMYGVYERLWHWLQTMTILALLFTGLIIHKPDLFGAFSFKYVVQVHNVLAAILVTNAALAVFYHLASGEIRQYLPQPRGFFNQAISQATFYVGGIFRGEEHPFEKTQQKKLNPLQQVTYFGILNVLLPLQMITGILMWGAQRWPVIAVQLGGLPFLAPFHTLISWLFASFIVAHVYLTTTGHAPMAGIKSMIMGWDEVEVHGDAQAPAAGD